MERTGVASDVQPHARKERREIGKGRRRRSEPRGSFGRRHHGLRERSVGPRGPERHDRRHSIALEQLARAPTVTLWRPALVRCRIARTRMDRHGSRAVAQGRLVRVNAGQVDSQRARSRLGANAEEAKESLVPIETADMRRCQTGSARMEEPGELSPVRGRIPHPQTGPTRACEEAALQDRVEVEHEVEPAPAQLPQERAQLADRGEGTQAHEGVAQGFAGEDQHLVDPRIAVERSGGGSLHEPRHVRSGVRGAQRGDRGQRANHVPHGAEPDHEDAIGDRRRRKRFQTDDRGRCDGTPRAGGERRVV